MIKYTVFGKYYPIILKGSTKSELKKMYTGSEIKKILEKTVSDYKIVIANIEKGCHYEHLFLGAYWINLKRHICIDKYNNLEDEIVNKSVCLKIIRRLDKILSKIFRKNP